jgi:hypothetical protein
MLSIWGKITQFVGKLQIIQLFFASTWQIPRPDRHPQNCPQAFDCIQKTWATAVDAAAQCFIVESRLINPLS